MGQVSRMKAAPATALWVRLSSWACRGLSLASWISGRWILPGREYRRRRLARRDSPAGRQVKQNKRVRGLDGTRSRAQNVGRSRRLPLKEGTMRHPGALRPSLSGLVAAVALVVACLSVTGALAAGKAVKVLTGGRTDFSPGGFITVGPGDVDIAEARCPAGYTAIGGGFDEQGSATLNLLGSKVLTEGANPVGWKVEVVNSPLGQAGDVQAVATCIKFDHASIPTP